MAKNEEKKIIWAWGALLASYLIFIGILSYWLPYSIDELGGTPQTLGALFANIENAYLTLTPRFCIIPNAFILYLGKWSFVMLNPLVQMLLCWLVFYLIYWRGPCLRCARDIYPAGLILFLSVFAVAQPDNSVFWLGGALNYSWSLLPFLLALILARGLLSVSFDFKDAALLRAGMFLGGIILGMGGETTGPAALILFSCVLIYFKFQKKPVPKWLYFLLFGMAAGLAFLFLSPANDVKKHYLMFRYFYGASFSQKLFWHLQEMHDFIILNLFLPLITFFALALIFWDKGIKAFKEEGFVLILSCYLLFLMTFFALVFAPAPARALYPASMLSNISFIALLKYLQDSCKIKLFRFLSLAVLCVTLPLLPLFSYTYYDLHKQEVQRNVILTRALQTGAAEVFIPKYKGLPFLSENLSFSFCDPVSMSPLSLLKRIYPGKFAIIKDEEKNLGREADILLGSI